MNLLEDLPQQWVGVDSDDLQRTIKVWRTTGIVYSEAIKATHVIRV